MIVSQARPHPYRASTTTDIPLESFTFSMTLNDTESMVKHSVSLDDIESMLKQVLLKSTLSTTFSVTLGTFS